MHCTIKFLLLFLPGQVEHWPNQSQEPGLNHDLQTVHPHPWPWVSSLKPGTEWLHHPSALLRWVYIASTLRSMLRNGISLTFLLVMLSISPQIWAWHRLFSKQLGLEATWSSWVDLGPYSNAKGAMACAMAGEINRALGHQKPFQIQYRNVRKGLCSGILSVSSQGFHQPSLKPSPFPQNLPHL